MGIKSFGNNAEDFVSKFLRARSFDSTGLDAANPEPPSSGLTATGGVISDYIDGSDVYRAHIFTSSGTFDVSALGNFGDTVEYLVVAGGGGGAGSFQGGGSGAGGLRTNLSSHPLSAGNPSFSVTAGPTSYTITIGAGGAGNVGGPTGGPGTKGQDSYFGPPSTPNGITAEGGGYAGWYNEAGGPGGSGGGGGDNTGGTAGFGNNPSTPAPEGGPYAWTEGNNGGNSSPFPYPGSPNFRGSGGGGAGGSGIPGGPGSPFPPTAGDGGIGSQVAIAGPPTFTGVGALNPGPGEYQWFSGGGGAGGFGAPGGTGGIGGGGNGGTGPGSPNPAGNGIPGVYGTGGGGGSSVAAPATPYTGIGGNGGSGIVVVRYQIAQLTTTSKATGGAISYYDNKTIHTFTSSGTFTAPGTFNETVEYVVIGGGGSGGRDGTGDNSGGGGAGGYLTSTTPISGPQAITIQVGAGGYDANGTNSFFGPSITATGGGAGGNVPAPGDGYPGGSGGGGGYPDGTAGAGTPGQGNPGANGRSDAPAYAGGGGGGAGGSASTTSTTAHGGIGVQLPATFRNPVSQPGPAGGGLGYPGPGGGYYWVAGGGGGGVDTVPTANTSGGGPGGPYAGAGPGGPQSAPGKGVNAQENSGSGGGGNSLGPSSGKYGQGGSGIVLIAYPS